MASPVEKVRGLLQTDSTRLADLAARRTVGHRGDRRSSQFVAPRNSHPGKPGLHWHSL